MSFRTWLRLIAPIAAMALVVGILVFGQHFLWLLVVPPLGSRARLEPAQGTYYGVNLDWNADTAAAYDARLGHRASVFVQFFNFPLSQADFVNFDSMVNQITAVHGMAMVTLQPQDGLSTVSQSSVDGLADELARANAAGVPVFVRFAHEMNGSWYAWGEQPIEYVRAFRMVAETVHRRAPWTAMMWAPSYGGGYPFSGGQYEAKPGSADFKALDTNGDGKLSMADDPYSPYYPGDDAVDWVGMSLYHWGSAYPWGENDIPEHGKFIAQLTGDYNGLGGDDRAIPDFYHVYYDLHHKPVSITETAALYQAGQPGPSELALKQAWWREVFDPAMLAAHPGIKMINWFEHMKPETEVHGAVIDWRATGSADILAAYRADLPANQLVFAP